MQKPNEEKREAICKAAAKLFAQRPFHEVRLDDVAAAASIGKGTLYVYFRSKEDLFVSLISEAFEKIIDTLETKLDNDAIEPREALRTIVRELVGFAVRNPFYFEIMRIGEIESMAARRCERQRGRLTGLIQRTICGGARRGIFSDPHPELTALFIPGLVRSAMLFGPRGLSERTLSSQILRILEHGLLQPPSSGA